MENKKTSTDSTTKNWLILILILIVLIAAVVIIVLGQSGRLFKGEAQIDPDIGTAVVSKTAIEEKSNGPFIHVSAAHGDSCAVGSILGTASCPFSSIDKAEQHINDQDIDTVEIRLQEGGPYSDQSGINLTGGRKSIIGGWDESFSRINSYSLVFFTVNITNANGSVENINFRNVGANRPFVEVDNTDASDGTRFITRNLNFDNINNTDSIIKYVGNNYNSSGLIEKITVKNSNAIPGSIIEVLGNSTIRIQNNHINNSEADDSIIHVEDNIEIINNLITNTPQDRTNTEHAVLIESGDDVKLINNTIVNNDFSGFAVKQNGEGLMWTFNNLIDDNDNNYIFDIAEINELAARGNTWGIIDYRENKEFGVNQENNFSCNPNFQGGDVNTPEYYKLGGDSDCLNRGWTTSNIIELVSPDYFEVERPTGEAIDPGFSEYILPLGYIAPIKVDQFFIPAECGNGELEEGEECDDGNTIDGDGCSSTCMIEEELEPVCGNGVLEQGEECDDGNTIDGDGCSSLCEIEEEEEEEEEDICPNIEGIQTVLPDNYEFDANNNCVQIEDEEDEEDEEEEILCGEWTDVSDNDPEYDIWNWLCEKDILQGNPDGTLRPDDSLTRAELLALAFRASDYENEYEVDDDASYCFNDVDDEWFARYACTAEDLGFVEGYTGNEFRPASTVILAEGLKMFLGALDEPFDINSDPNRWYFDMLRDAADDNYLPYTLTSEDVVGPIELTRRKAANMLYRIMIYR